MKRKPDPLLRLQPWKIVATYGPLERILHRLETEGTIEVAGPQIVFNEGKKDEWHDAVAALRGIIEFHQIAQSRYGIHANTDAITRFANKLEAGAPIFEDDLSAVRADIESCKRQTLRLRTSQAEDIIRTIQIGMHLEEIKVAA